MSRIGVITVAIRQPAGWSGPRIPSGARDLYSSPERSSRLWGPPSYLFNGYWYYFSAVKRPERDSDHLLPSRLQMSGAIHLFPLQALMAPTGTRLSFCTFQRIDVDDNASFAITVFFPSSKIRLYEKRMFDHGQFYFPPMKSSTLRKIAHIDMAKVCAITPTNIFSHSHSSRWSMRVSESIHR